MDIDAIKKELAKQVKAQKDLSEVPFQKI